MIELTCGSMVVGSGVHKRLLARGRQRWSLLVTVLIELTCGSMVVGSGVHKRLLARGRQRWSLVAALIELTCGSMVVGSGVHKRLQAALVACDRLDRADLGHWWSAAASTLAQTADRLDCVGRWWLVAACVHKAAARARPHAT